MNVLFLDQFGDLGGAQFCLLDLLPAVLARGWKPHVMIPEKGAFAKRLAALGVETSAIPCGPYRPGAKSIHDVFRFGSGMATQVRAIRERNFDLLYVNGPRLLPAAALALRHSAPVLFHAHNYLGQSYARMAAGWSIRAMGAAVVACSRFVAEPLRRFATANVHVIANGTRDMVFRQRTFEPGCLRIGIIGKLCSQKGSGDFLRAARMVAKDFPDSRFIICGSGDDTELRHMAQGLAVEFLGWQDDIPWVFSKLDLLVIASEQEGLPRVMLEAFSAGVPVIAYPAGGVSEAIEEGQTGFLIPEFSPEALASRIGTVSGELKRVAIAARQCWEERYSVTNYQARILDVMQATERARRVTSAIRPLPQHTR